VCSAVDGVFTSFTIVEKPVIKNALKEAERMRQLTLDHIIVITHNNWSFEIHGRKDQGNGAIQRLHFSTNKEQVATYKSKGMVALEEDLGLIDPGNRIDVGLKLWLERVIPKKSPLTEKTVLALRNEHWWNESLETSIEFMGFYEEEIRAMYRVFMSIDVGGDGDLDTDEFFIWLVHTHTPPPPPPPPHPAQVRDYFNFVYRAMCRRKNHELIMETKCLSLWTRMSVLQDVQWTLENSCAASPRFACSAKKKSTGSASRLQTTMIPSTLKSKNSKICAKRWRKATRVLYIIRRV
jgi:hypothetical protein